VFIIVVLVVTSILYGYVGARVIAPFDISTPGLIVFWTIVGFFAITPIGGMILRARGSENPFNDFLLWVGFMGMGIFALAFVIFLVRDLGWVTGFYSKKLFSAFSGNESQSIQVDSERRQFLLMSMNIGIAGFTSLLGGIGLFQATKRPSVVNKTIAIKTLPKTLGGLKIVQISDLHIGPTIKADYAMTVVNQVNELKPDLIVFTGDMVDGSVDHLTDDVEPLRELRAKYGKFFVTGNHEYYSGAERWIEKVADLGMTVLMNEHIILNIEGESLAIAGVTDISAHRVLKSHRSDPQKAVEGIPASMPTILLAHQPRTAEQTNGLNIDLMLSGHTHGGQFIPFNLAVARIEKYSAGYYVHGDMQVYVNRGTGYWGPPMRLGIPSEITLFTLHTKQV